MTRKQLVAAIKKEQKVIAASRDRLRELVSGVEELSDDADDAIDSLEYAADALSRTV